MDNTEIINKIKNIIKNEFNYLDTIDINIRDNANVLDVLIDCGKTNFIVNLKNKSILLKNLYKCHNISGTKILETIINVGKQINLQFCENENPDKLRSANTIDSKGCSLKPQINTIYLEDQSGIFFEKQKCFIDLKILNYLLYGKTWYERHGFISDDDDIDDDIDDDLFLSKELDNKQCVNMKLKDVLKKNFNKINKDEINKTIKKILGENQTFMGFLQEHFDENKTSHEIAKELYKNVRNKQNITCDDIEFKKLKVLEIIFNKILVLPIYLKLELQNPVIDDNLVSYIENTVYDEFNYFNRENIEFITKKKSIIVKLYCVLGEKNSKTEFEIKTDIKEIFLLKLLKCNENTGTKILKSIIKIGKQLNFNGISLIDVSVLSFKNNCDEINLSVLNILLHGKSWYERFGFKSMSNSPYNNDVFNDMVINYPLKKIKTFFKETSETYNAFNFFFNDTEQNESIKKNAEKLNDIVRKNGITDCNDINLKKLILIVKNVKRFIFYENYLKLNLREKTQKIKTNQTAINNLTPVKTASLISPIRSLSSHQSNKSLKRNKSPQSNKSLKRNKSPQIKKNVNAP